MNCLSAGVALRSESSVQAYELDLLYELNLLYELDPRCMSWMVDIVHWTMVLHNTAP